MKRAEPRRQDRGCPPPRARSQPSDRGASAPRTRCSRARSSTPVSPLTTPVRHIARRSPLPPDIARSAQGGRTPPCRRITPGSPLRPWPGEVRFSSSSAARSRAPPHRPPPPGPASASARGVAEIARIGAESTGFDRSAGSSIFAPPWAPGCHPETTSAIRYRRPARPQYRDDEGVTPPRRGAGSGAPPEGPGARRRPPRHPLG